MSSHELHQPEEDHETPNARVLQFPTDRNTPLDSSIADYYKRAATEAEDISAMAKLDNPLADIFATLEAVRTGERQPPLRVVSAMGKSGLHLFKH